MDCAATFTTLDCAAPFRTNLIGIVGGALACVLTGVGDYVGLRFQRDGRVTAKSQSAADAELAEGRH